MRKHLPLSLLVAGVLLVGACASTAFDSTWSSPDAKRIAGFTGKKIAAVVVTKEASLRRAGEDTLAAQLTARGAEGIPSYTVLDKDTSNEAAARAALEKAGCVGVVVMRPVGRDKEVVSTPGMYMGPTYGGYWGGYYGYGWGGAYVPPTVTTNTIIRVETLVYALKDNKLLWAGQSATTNPSDLESFIKELVSKVASEMKKEGIL